MKNRSKSKFDTDIAESLYMETPDDQTGSVDELGWYGLFREEGVILFEDSYGFVWTLEADTGGTIEEKWQAINDAYESFYGDCEVY